MKKSSAYVLPIIFICLFTGLSFGQSSQVRDAGSGAFLSRGHKNWSEPGNIAINGASASIELDKNDKESNYLVGSDYGFNIPSNATITGLQLNITRKTQNNGNALNDLMVTLHKNQNTESTNRAHSTKWSNSSLTQTYGGSGDLWDMTWTPADINNPKFGAALAIILVGNKNTGSVERMEIMVYYNAPATNDIDFNGEDSYANFGNDFNFTSDFSIELWMKRNPNAPEQETLISKREDLNGYDLGLSKGKLRFNWNSKNYIEAPYALGYARWYHVAVTYQQRTYRLYIDGIEVEQKSGEALPFSNNGDALLGAKRSSSFAPQHFYDGSMDELRIWNKGLSQSQIRQMMNQSIEKNGSAVHGAVLGLAISDLKWKDLEGYYQMNQGVDIFEGKLADNSGRTKQGILIGMTSMQLESAPLPYATQTTGEWSDAGIWINGDVQLLPNSVGIDGETVVDWNIVKIDHQVNATGMDITVAGLLVNGPRLTIQNKDLKDGQRLEVSEYLNLSEGAVLKLVGESQLIQGDQSILGIGTGIIERDQQGTGNMFNYNYWGSPVHTTGSKASKTYSLREVLHDGDAQINWIAAHTFTPTTAPISISSRWLYTYKGTSDDYNVWKQINPNTPIDVGVGFLMKGGGIHTAPDKNYTFNGRPNNGTITVPISKNESMVIGNPYPSAIDSKLFIGENKNVLSEGTLLFWQQSPQAATHVLKDYQGSYAYLNLSGYLKSVSPAKILGSGNANPKPMRYIPVGQGFFVDANNKGGNITFKNSHRVFKKESDEESIFYRTPEEPSKTLSNSEKMPVIDDIQRVRLAFKTPEGATRNLLLAFTSDNVATDGVDYGYDASNNDDVPSDLSFLIDNKKFVIQGVGAFDVHKKYPLDMTLKIAGNVELALTDLENFESPIDVFVHDAVLDTYAKINSLNFQLQLEAGTYKDRFSIVFRPDSTLSAIDQDFKEISANYLQKTDEIYVKPPASIEVRQIYLINIAGQTVKSWNMTNRNFGQEYKIPVRDVSEGNYILKVETNTNSYTKKIIIKF